MLADQPSEVRRYPHSDGFVIIRELNDGDTVKLEHNGRQYFVAMNQPDDPYSDFVVHANGNVVVGLSMVTHNFRLFAMTKGQGFRPLSPGMIVDGLDWREDAWEAPVQHKGVIAGVLFRGSTRNERYVYRISEAGLELGTWPSAAQVILVKNELTVVTMDGTMNALASRKYVKGAWLPRSSR